MYEGRLKSYCHYLFYLVINLPNLTVIIDINNTINRKIMIIYVKEMIKLMPVEFFQMQPSQNNSFTTILNTNRLMV